MFVFQKKERKIEKGKKHISGENLPFWTKSSEIGWNTIFRPKSSEKLGEKLLYPILFWEKERNEKFRIFHLKQTKIQNYTLNPKP